jgi:hypothetical protein
MLGWLVASLLVKLWNLLPMKNVVLNNSTTCRDAASEATSNKVCMLDSSSIVSDQLDIFYFSGRQWPFFICLLIWLAAWAEGYLASCNCITLSLCTLPKRSPYPFPKGRTVAVCTYLAMTNHLLLPFAKAARNRLLALQEARVHPEHKCSNSGTSDSKL